MLNDLRQLAVLVATSVFGTFAALSAQAGSDTDLRLLMIEQAGCAYCVAFNRDIAPIYEKTAEGGIAPLIHADIRKDLPDGITLASRPYVTPTFILIGPEGHEISRMTGFPGEDFFWPYITQMIADAQAKLEIQPLN